MSDQNIQFDLELAIKNFDASIKEAGDRINKFHDTFKKQNSLSSRSIASFLGNFSSAIAVKGLQQLNRLNSAIINIGKSSLRAAIDANEVTDKYSVVFQEVSNEAERMAQELAKSYGLARTQTKELLGDTGDLLSGFGFTGEAALDLSVQVQKLAVDLASFTNFSGGAEGASKALTKALLGERESVKALGISILEEDVKKQVAINTAKGLRFESERQAKAQATLDIAISQSKNAIGDYARTKDEVANQEKLFTTRIKDLTEVLGDSLIPVYALAVKAVNDYLAAFDPQILTNFINNGMLSVVKAVDTTINSLIEAQVWFNKNLESIEILTAGILTAVTAYGLYIAAQNATVIATAVATKATMAFNAVLRITPWGLVLTAVAAVGAGLYALASNWELVKAKTMEYTANILNFVAPAFDSLLGMISAVVGVFDNDFATSIENSRGKLKLLAEDMKLQSEAKLLALEEEKNAEIEIDKEKNEALLENKVNFTSQLESLLKNHHDSKKKISQEELKTEKTDKDKSKEANKAYIAALFSQDKQWITTKEQWDDLETERKIQNTKDTLNTISSLTSSNNKTLFTIGKASAIATATIDGFAAVQKALASAPPPFNFALAGLVGAATAVNIKNISSQKMPESKKYNTGGVVDYGSPSGDTTIASVNKWETIMSPRMAANAVYNMSNTRLGGGDESSIINAIMELKEAILNRPIVIYADDNEIARSTSRGVQNGVSIGVSR